MSRRWLPVLVAAVAIGVGGATVLYLRRAPSSSSTMAMPRTETRPAAQAAEVTRGQIEIDPRRQQLIGVRTVPVQRTLVSGIVRMTATVRADETRQADVNVRFDGWIRDLFVNYTGQPVRRGDRLFTLYSPDLQATTSELLLSVKNREQAQTATVPDAAVYADQLVVAARRRLAQWDISAEQIAAIEQSGRPLDTITITAPAAGIVTDKQAIAGMRVVAGQTLFRIADLSTVWVEGDVYERDLSSVRVGQRATVTLDAYPDRRFSGRAIYIVPTVNEQTRTGRVRFALTNPGGLLKPGMFANIELRTGDREGLTVPTNALLDSGDAQVVFVAEGEGRFTPRRVKVGSRLADAVEILEGVKEGEQVATNATFFLDSESQLRAGLQNYDSPPSTAAASPVTGPAPTITFASVPDPPKTGDNTFEVHVTSPDGTPIADADVTVQLFMPAMPTMNMPAMRNETKLTHVANGVYRGPGQVMMAGKWEATVTVTRNGQRVGNRQFPLVSR